MITWVTPYQASFALRPLTLHADEVPPGAEFARKQLGQFVRKVLSHAPNLPSHTGHPQWDYHWPDFTRSRHSYLSSKLGALTETEPPPAGSSELDRLWWRLDGAEKSLRRKNSQPGSAPRLVNDLPASDQTFANENGAALAAEQTVVAVHADARSRQNATKMRREYESLIRPRVKTAGIPVVRWQGGHESPPALAERMSRRIARSTFYQVFGRWPHVTMLDPRWAAVQPLLRAVETAKAKGARDALVVSGPTGLLDIGGFDGRVAHVTYDGFMSGLLHKALAQRQQFDLCILDLRQEDIPQFAEIARQAGPYVRPGATIVGFAMLPAQQLGALSSDRNGKMIVTPSLVPISEMPVYYDAAISRSKARYGGRVRPQCRWLRIALQAPRFWLANRAVKEDANSEPARAAGVTIEMQMPSPVAAEQSS